MNEPIEHGYTDYKSLTEAEFAYKYFDWEFYLGRRDINLERMTKDEIIEVLKAHPFYFRDITLRDIEKKARYDYARSMGYR